MASPVRITGLSSGMDTDGIIKQLMKIETMKVDKQFQSKEKLQYKVDAYKAVNAKLKTFRDTYATVLGDKGMMTASTYKNYDVKFAGTSAANNAVQISGTAAAKAGAYSISVSQIASAGKAQSTSRVTGGNGSYLQLSDTLESANKKIGGDSGAFSFYEIGAIDENGDPGMVPSRDADGKIIYQDKMENGQPVYVQEKNEDGTPKFEADGTTPVYKQKVDENGDPVFENGNPVYEIEQEAVLEQKKEKFVSFTISNGLNEGDEGYVGKTFHFTSDTTINQMINAVNAEKELGVTMGYSQISDKFTFESRETGAGNSFELSAAKYSRMEIVKDVNGDPTYDADGNVVREKVEYGSESDFLAGLKLDMSGNKAVVAEGKDAQVIINGESLTMSSNNFELDGVKFTLLNTTEVKGDDGTTRTDTVNFTLQQNVDASMDKIKGFIDAYNELIKEINGKIDEKTYRDYKPLTSDERAAMTENEAKLWDEKAMSGTLRRDSGLTNLLSELRNTFYSVIEGTGMMASDIGIKTSANYLEGGTIEIDETKLRKALQEDPDTVMQLFTKTSSSTDEATKYKESGLIQKLNLSMQKYVKNNEYTSLSLTEDRLTDATDKLAEMNEKLADIEEKYYLKFAALEKAMSQLNSQSSNLASMLGGL